MRGLLLFLFLSFGHLANCQTFLADFKKFKLQQIRTNYTLDSLRKTEQNKTLHLTKKKIKTAKQQWIIETDKQIKQFDTVFKTYKNKTGFDFNSAKSLLIIFQTDIQSNLNKFIIISTKDTITYGERWKRLGLHSYDRQIVYEPFLDTTKPKGFIIIDDRDSLLKLATKRDFVSAQKLAKENPCNDGSTSTIIVAENIGKHYKFEYCFLQPFMFMPIWRKE
jgi:hypothetical protein